MKAIRMNLKQVMKDIGEDYMKLIREGQAPSEIANSSMYYKCDVCGGWFYTDAIEVTSGQCGSDVCINCVNDVKKQKNQSVMDAIEFLNPKVKVSKWILTGVEKSRREKWALIFNTEAEAMHRRQEIAKEEVTEDGVDYENADRFADRLDEVEGEMDIIETVNY